MMTLSLTLSNGEIVLDSLLVDEDYAMKHPVWVINKNDFEYKDLPDFINNEFVKDGVLFSSELSQKNNANTLRSSSSTPVYVFKLGTIQATKHHDDWVNGGSEFEFKNSSPLAPSYATTGVTVIRKTIARKHINKNGTVFTMNEPLNTDWTEAQIQNALKVIETDNGGTKHWEASLGVNSNGKNFSVSAKIPYGSNDDHIYEKILARTFILSSANLNSNGSPKTNDYEGLRWTMYIQKVN